MFWTYLLVTLHLPNTKEREFESFRIVNNFRWALIITTALNESFFWLSSLVLCPIHSLTKDLSKIKFEQKGKCFWIKLIQKEKESREAGPLLEKYYHHCYSSRLLFKTTNLGQGEENGKGRILLEWETGLYWTIIVRTGDMQGGRKKTGISYFCFGKKRCQQMTVRHISVDVTWDSFSIQSRANTNNHCRSDQKHT